MPQKNNQGSIFSFAVSIFCAVSLINCGQTTPEPFKIAESKSLAIPDSHGPVEWSFSQPRGSFFFLSVSAIGTEHRSVLKSEEGHVLGTVQLPYLRSAPSFFCAEAPAVERVLLLNFNVLHSTMEAPVEIQVFHLPLHSRAERSRVNGLRSLCKGLQEVAGEDPALWAKNLQALQGAAKKLRDSGEMQLALWARYFHAYFEYFPLYHYESAIEQGNVIIAAAGKSGMRDLEMLAHQLVGQALLERDAGDSEELSREQLEQAHQAFDMAAAIAAESSNLFEQAWAYNSSGTAYHYQDKLAESYAQHDKALGMVMASNDEYLINLFGGNLALTYEKQGDIQRALATLQDIYQNLQKSGNQAELTHILNEQGRIYINLHLYPDAIRTLTEALELARGREMAEDTGRISMFLGKAYREIGQAGKSDYYLQDAIAYMERSNYGRGLRDAHGLLADNHRQRGEVEGMTFHRKKQSEYLSTDFDRAAWLADSARDAIKQGDFQLAIALLEQSQKLAVTTEMHYLAQLGRLQECVLILQGNSKSACDLNAAKSAFAAVSTLENPRFAFEGRRLWAELLDLQGNTSAAIVTTKSLIDDLEFYRLHLPGVLGSWYWDSRAGLFHFYMRLVLSARDSNEQVSESLLALQRLQNASLTAAGAQTELQDKPKRSQRIRQLINTLDGSSSEQDQIELSAEIDNLLLETSGHHQVSERTTKADDLRPLLAELAPNASLLAYYFAEDVIYAWTGTAKGLEQHILTRPDDIDELINATLVDLRVINPDRLDARLERLGEILIAPLKDHLSKRVYVLTSGKLSGLPLEALIVEGKRLLANHEIANLMSIEALANLEQHNKQTSLASAVFLAGNPRLEQDDLAHLAGAQTELNAIKSLFGEAMTTLVEQGALRLDAFSSPEFLGADIIHIATHAEINTRYPELSRIILSKTNGSDEPEILMPAHLRGKNINAGLVVLSACSITTREGFEFEAGLGFVTGFLQAGADSVVASLWPVADAGTKKLMLDFYQEISNGKSAMSALTIAKRESMNAARTGGVHDWAAFQIFLN